MSASSPAMPPRSPTCPSPARSSCCQLTRTLSLNVPASPSRIASPGADAVASPVVEESLDNDLDCLVSFFCSANKFLHEGTRLYVLGSLDSLGKWDVSKALPLSDEGSLHLCLHRDQIPFEFKFIVRRGERLIWQKGPNYCIQTAPMRVSQSVQFFGGEITTAAKVPLSYHDYAWANYQGMLRSTEDAQVVWESTTNVAIDSESRLGRMVAEAREREGETRFDLRLALMDNEAERREQKRSDKRLQRALGDARSNLADLLSAFEELRAQCEGLARLRAADADEMGVLRAALRKAEEEIEAGRTARLLRVPPAEEESTPRRPARASARAKDEEARLRASPCPEESEEEVERAVPRRRSLRIGDPPPPATPPRRAGEAETLRASRDRETVRVFAPPQPPEACPAVALLPSAFRPAAGRRALLPPDFFSPSDLAARILSPAK